MFEFYLKPSVKLSFKVWSFWWCCSRHASFSLLWNVTFMHSRLTFDYEMVLMYASIVRRYEKKIKSWAANASRSGKIEALVWLQLVFFFFILFAFAFATCNFNVSLTLLRTFPLLRYSMQARRFSHFEFSSEFKGSFCSKSRLMFMAENYKSSHFNRQSTF